MYNKTDHLCTGNYSTALFVFTARQHAMQSAVLASYE